MDSFVWKIFDVLLKNLYYVCTCYVKMSINDLFFIKKENFEKIKLFLLVCKRNMICLVFEEKKHVWKWMFIV